MPLKDIARSCAMARKEMESAINAWLMAWTRETAAQLEHADSIKSQLKNITYNWLPKPGKIEKKPSLDRCLETAERHLGEFNVALQLAKSGSAVKHEEENVRKLRISAFKKAHHSVSLILGRVSSVKLERKLPPTTPDSKVVTAKYFAQLPATANRVNNV